MKKSLSLVLAIAMVFSMFSSMAFAAEEKAAGEYLQEIGVITGDLSGDLNEDSTWSRQDVTVILSRLMGLEDAAADTAKGHSFADVTDPFYDGYITWAKDEELFNGHSDVRFGYGESITNQQFLAVMLRALGYDVAYEDTIATAVELGLADEGTDAGAEATRGSYYDVVVTTLHTENSAGVVLGEALELEGFEPVAPETLEVAEVTANNLKQVVVEFNQDVADNSAVSNKDNYTVKDGKVVDVTVDGMTATLTLEKKFDQQTTKLVTISDKILSEKEELEVKFFDTTVPEVVSAEVIGKDTIKVTFSEPINAEELDTRTEKRAGFGLTNAEGNNVYVDDVTFAKNNTEANVEFYSNFVEGEYTLEVKSAYADYAAFKVVSEEITVDVIVDEAAPEVVDFKDAKPYGVTLVFNEDITVETTAKADFYHTNSKNYVDVLPTPNGNELELKFHEDYKMPSGTVYVYVAGEAVADLWDNENVQQLRIAVEVIGDDEGPVVESITVDAQDKLTVVFNEDVNPSTVDDEDDQFTILDADGDEIINVVSKSEIHADDANKVVLNLSKNINDDNTLVIENVEDIYGNEIEKTEFDFFAEDVTAVDIDYIELAANNAKLYNDGTDLQRLVIDFGEAMAVEGDYSVLDLTKYRFITQTAGETLKDLDGYSINAVDNNEKVEIVIDLDDASALTGVESLDIAVSRIADASGNKHAAFTEAARVTVDAISAIDFKAGTAKATGKKTIEVELTDSLEIFDDNDFSLIIGTTEYTVTNSTYGFQVDDNSDGNKLTFILDFELSEIAEVTGQGVKVAVAGAQADIDSVNVYGTQMLETAEEDVLDAIKPEIKTVVKNGNNIDITFSEGVYVSATQASLAVTDFVILKENGDQLTAGVDYTIVGLATTSGTADAAITIDLQGVDFDEELTVKTAGAPNYIKDASDNKLSKHDGKEVEMTE